MSPRQKKVKLQTKESLFDPVSPAHDIKQLAAEAKSCRNCDLWRNATQTVFGEGRENARIMLIGEVPGDQEDLEGRPFIGPAGQFLRSKLEEAGFEMKEVYVTNAVKHFKWEPRGKRRIHKTPNSGEIKACKPWLEAEIAAVKPQVIVCLGATAAKTLLGKDFRVTQHRGEFIDSDLAPHVLATVHPSSILRAPDEATRHQQTAEFLQDLKKIAKITKR
jgi:DNA polymerase